MGPGRRDDFAGRGFDAHPRCGRRGTTSAAGAAATVEAVAMPSCVVRPEMTEGLQLWDIETGFLKKPGFFHKVSFASAGSRETSSTKLR